MPRGEPTVLIQGRVTRAQKERLEAFAAERGFALATWVRDVVLREAGLDGGGAGMPRVPTGPTRPPAAAAVTRHASSADAKRGVPNLMRPDRKATR